MNWLVKDILAATGGHLLCGDPGQQFQGVGIDSRTIDPAAFFVAIRGENHDAHAFLPQVIDRGVKGVVVESDTHIPMDVEGWNVLGVACVAVEDTTRALGALGAFQRRQMDIPVVAISGSNGKTTTRQMTASVMAQTYHTLATEGNLNNEVGLPLTLFNLEATHQAAVLELGINHFGEMDRLGAICKPTMGMITNVGPAHLEFLGSLEGVARAKGELLAHIGKKGYAILNKDDDHVSTLEVLAPCRVFYFGLSPQADAWAEGVTETPAGITFDLVLPDERLAVNLKTHGRFMVVNALAAASVGHLAGISGPAIKQGLESFVPVGGRLRVIETTMGVKIIDDTYNANPASMQAAIQTYAALRKSGRGFMVLGDMLELGEQAQHLHRRVGARAGEAGAVKIYAHGDHADEVISGAREAGMASSDLVADSKEEITADLIQLIRPGDWVLVKGSRGMAMETVVRAICDWTDTVID
jgi:UDP-N-acetylmuramoyl-tripeptide--D-alanyl-D-alanine ligase